MKLFKNSKCPEEWVIQAFIDRELDKQQAAKLHIHLQVCTECNARVEVRKNRVNQVFELLDLIDKNPLAAKNSIAKRKRNTIHFVAWASVAASALILISLFTLFNMQTPKDRIAIEQTCHWVEIEDVGFQSEFVSPNRLYRMRAIEISRTDSKGEQSKTILAKQCNIEEVNN
jgi:uncharacterized protein YlaI